MVGAGVVEMQDLMRVWLREMKKIAVEVPAQDKKKESSDNEREREVPPGGTIRRTRAGRSRMVSEDGEADGPRSLCSIQKHLCSSRQESYLHSCHF